MIPTPIIAFGVASAIAVGAYAAGHWQGSESKQRDWDAAISEQRQQALDAQLEARRIENARSKESQRVADEARARVQAANRSADDARAAADGLRWAASSAARRCSSGDSAASERGEADKLADVVGQCAQQYREVAAVADAAIIAGQACERAYLALTPK